MEVGEAIMESLLKEYFPTITSLHSYQEDVIEKVLSSLDSCKLKE